MHMLCCLIFLKKLVTKYKIGTFCGKSFRFGTCNKMQIWKSALGPISTSDQVPIWKPDLGLISTPDQVEILKPDKAQMSQPDLAKMSTPDRAESLVQICHEKIVC